MFNHIIYKGKAKYKKKNKIILVVIRKQPGELDWILPVLDKLKNNFNIIVIFEKKIALKLLKENEILYNFFLEVVFGYIQNSFFKSIFFRVANKLSNFFKIKFLSNFFQNKIYEKYYNISDLNNNIKKRFSNFDLKKLKILMQDFTDNSPWVKKFSEKDFSLKIISYPHTTNIFSYKKKKIKNKINFNNSSFLFLSSSSDILHFKNRFSQSYIFTCGFPKYEKSWLKKIENFYKKKIQKNKNIFVAYKGFEKKKYSKNMYIDQVESLFDFVQREKNIRLIFKFHPNAPEEKVFMSVANKYSKHLWKITKEHLHIATKKSSIFVCFYANASILDSLASGKVPIELWKINNDKKLKSAYSGLKLCLATKNRLSLNKNLKNFLYNKNLTVQKKILNKFEKLFRYNRPIDITKKIILKISKLSFK